MKLTESAFNSTRLTFFAALLILVSGVVAFLSFPSQEEPSTTVRDAIVIVANPGLPAERMEQLVARPLEERLRLAAAAGAANALRQDVAMITPADIEPLRAEVGLRRLD